MVKEIPLTRGQVALVDDGDYEYLNQWKWYAKTSPRVNGPNEYYATRREYAGRKNGKHYYKSINMARLIMNAPKNRVIDHINGHSLDNRRENLRVVTQRENIQNLRNPGASKYPGVAWINSIKKWRASITVNYKQIYLGQFDEEHQAAKAYEWAISLLKNGEAIPGILQTTKTSKFRGVSYSKSKGKYIAQKKFRGKNRHICCADTEEEAHRGYLRKCEEWGVEP